MEQPTVPESDSAATLRINVSRDGNLECSEILGQQLMEIFGTTDSLTFTDTFLTRLVQVMGDSNEVADQCAIINQIIPLIKAIGPRNELEGMLAIQMIGIHTMAMEMMKRAMISNQTVDGVNSNVNRVTKLTRTFIAQMEALDRHRGKGQQKITVEHVTVNEGGKAIVGNVEQGDRDDKKK